MSFLRKILKRIQSKNIQKNIYNLKKIAIIETQNTVSPFKQYDEVGYSNVNEIDNMIDNEVNKDVNTFKNISPYHNMFDEYIDKSSSFETPLPPPDIVLINNEQREYFNNLVFQKLGKERGQLFLNKIYGIEEVVPTTEIIDETAIETVDNVESTNLAEEYWAASNISNLENFNRLKKLLVKNGCPRNKVDTVAIDVINNKLNIKSAKTFFELSPEFVPEKDTPQNRINILSELIKENNPKIEEWLSLKGNWRNEQGIASLDKENTEGEGGGIGQTLTKEDVERGLLEQKEKSYSIIQKQKGANKLVAAFVQFYLRGIVKNMDSILTSVVPELLNNAIEEKKMMKYTNLEKANIYTKKIIDQYYSLLDDMQAQIEEIKEEPKKKKNKGRKKIRKGIVAKKGDFAYGNDYGEIKIPNNFLKEVFVGYGQDENIDKYRDYDAAFVDISPELLEKIIENYKNNSKQSDIMEWFEGNNKGIVTSSSLAKAYAKVKELKNYIINLYINGNNIDFILDNRINSEEKIKNNIEHFVGADVPEIEEPEKRRRIKNFIKGTIAQFNSSKRSSSKKFLEKLNKFSVDKNKFEEYRDLKSDLQYSVRSIIKGLVDVKQSQDIYSDDDFKALMGSIMPHNKIREQDHPQEYNYLIGKKSKEEYNNKKQKLTDYITEYNKNISDETNKRKKNIEESNRNIRKRNEAFPDDPIEEIEQVRVKGKIPITELRKLLKRNSSYPNIYDKKISKIKKEEKEKQKKILRYNKRILKKNNLDGIENWDGYSPLPYSVYSLKLNPAAANQLRLHDKNIERVKMGDREEMKNLDTKNMTTEEIDKKRVESLGLEDIKKEIAKNEKELDLFLEEYNLDKSQFILAKSLCEKAFLKISSLKSIKENIKFAQTGTIDDIIIEIEKSLNYDLLNIFNL